MPRTKKDPLQEGIKWAEKVHDAWMNGTGSEAEIQHAISETTKYLKPLASSEQGDPKACYWLGLISYRLASFWLMSEEDVLSEKEIQTVKEHFREAEAYLTRAMTRPSVDEPNIKFEAMFALASVYELRHAIGGEDRSQESMNMRVSAAEGGSCEAQLHMAFAHYTGEYLPQSMRESRFWIDKAKAGKDGLNDFLRHALESLDEKVTEAEKRGLLMSNSPRFIFVPRAGYGSN